jgi:hypothetical protein
MSGNDKPDKTPLSGTVMVPIGLAYTVVATVIFAVAGGSFYMGSLQNQIQVLTAKQADFDKQETAMKTEMSDFIAPLRREVKEGVEALRKDATERRQEAEKVANATSGMVQDVNNRLIRIETRLDSQVGFLAAQIPPAASTVPSVPPTPGRR